MAKKVNEANRIDKSAAKKDKIVILMLEGETEEEFYKKVISSVRNFLGENFECKVKIKSIHGVGKFKSKAVKYFEKKILKDNPDAEFTVFFCMDTDVFELSSKPPFDEKELRNTLLHLGAKKVEYIKAKKCIEDWFLKDLQGINKYLKLPKNTKPKGNTGVKKVEDLFKKGNKIYIKGKKSEGFINSLDIQKIMKESESELKPLFNALKGR